MRSLDIFPLSFSKLSGTGNDFIFIDHRRRFIPEDQQADFARAVCRRMFSVGADGLMLIEESDRADFRWRFYNSDGSEAEMCGNGSRCAARFAYEQGLVTHRRMCFETLAGLIEAELFEDNSVRVRLTDPLDFRENLELELGGQLRQLASINTGVPHAVMFVEENSCDVREWGRFVRFHPLFAPQGTNVNFVSCRASGELLVRTYERGVEDETRACGTGAVASALIAALQGRTASPVRVQTSGGECLTIHFNLDAQHGAGQVYLTGPTRHIYTGELSAESLL